MTKKELRSYCMLKKESEKIRTRITRLSRELQYLERGACESDVVTKGKRGKKALGTVKITGFPDRRYQDLKRQKTNAILANKMLMKEIEAQVDSIEQFICSIQDAEMRQILRLLCLSGDYPTWQQLANRLNRDGGIIYTADGLRVKVDRFLKK